MDNKENLNTYLDNFIVDKDTDTTFLSTFIKNKAKDIAKNLWRKSTCGRKYLSNF